jgi:transposase
VIEKQRKKRNNTIVMTGESFKSKNKNENFTSSSLEFSMHKRSPRKGTNKDFKYFFSEID